MYAAFENDEDGDEGDLGSSSQSLDARPLLASHRHAPSSSLEHPLAVSLSDSSEHNNSLLDNRPTLSRHASNRSVSAPATYDFEYDYASLPPPGSPPRPSSLALPNSYGNSNGMLPTSSNIPRPAGPGVLRRALGAILPTHYSRDGRGGGVGNDGVFGNVVAKPTVPAHSAPAADAPYLVPEETQKDAPPVRLPSANPVADQYLILRRLCSHTKLPKQTPSLHTGKTP
jgi:hypothetical protein